MAHRATAVARGRSEGRRPGDVIVDVGGTAVDDAAALGDSIGDREPGEEIRLKVQRDGQERTLAERRMTG